MIFSVSQTLTNNQSVNQMILDRFNIAKKKGQDFTWITSAFMPNFVKTISDYPLDEQEIKRLINPYRFFAKADDYKGNIPNFQDLRISNDNQLLLSNDRIVVLQNDQLVANVHPWRKQLGSVAYIEYVDTVENIVRVDHYDASGFLARRRYLDDMRQPVYDQYLDIDGEVVIVKNWDHIEGNEKSQITKIWLNFGNKKVVFNSEIDFFTYFLKNYVDDFKNGKVFLDFESLTRAVASADPGILNLFDDSEGIAKALQSKNVYPIDNLYNPNEQDSYLQLFNI